jgi:hypothetical protein
MSEPKNLLEYLDEMRKLQEERVKAGWVWKPHAWFNKDGDCLHVHWSDEREYVEDLQGQQTNKKGHPYMVMGLHRNMETKEPTGVTVYSIEQILKEVGFKLVPIEEKENGDFGGDID